MIKPKCEIAMADILAATYEQAYCRVRIFYDRTNPMEYFSESQIRERYRMWKPTIIGIAKLLDPIIGPKTDRNMALPTIIKVCIGL